MRLASLLLRQALPRYAAGALPGFLARRVEAALRQDPHLAHEYDMLRRAERAVAPHALSAAQRDVVEAALFSSSHEETHTGARVPAWAGAFAAASIAAFVFIAAPGDGHFGVGELAARGARIAVDPVGVKVTCMTRDKEAVIASASAGARKSLDSLRCPAESLLAFSTTNLSKSVRHVFVVGVAKDGSRRWYAPFAADAQAVAVAPGAVDNVLASLADTRGMPQGDVTLFVLVSDAPFSGDDVARALDSSTLPLSHLDRLPVAVPLQARIEMAP